VIEVGETYSSVTYEIRDPDGVLADAGAVTYVMTLPSGFTQAPAALTHDATGQYSFDYLTAMEGTHRFSVSATGGVLGALVRTLGGDVFEVESNATAVQLVSMIEVKDHLNIDQDDASDDEELRRVAVSASKRVEDATQLWHLTTVVEVLPPSSTLVLSRLPVGSVTSVVQDGVTTDAASYELVSGTLLQASTGYGSLWPASRGQVTVTYEAGASAVPSVIRDAVLATVKHVWRSQRGATTSLTYALPLDALQLLQPYLRASGVA
jgi:uncharacterized phiE125 gp8 family phage protein